MVAGGAGASLLGIVGVWAAMFAIAWLISRWTGGRPQYLESWRFDDGETVLWRDDRADVYVLRAMARPAVARPLRLHRARVLVTARRIVVAMSEMFTGRQRVVYVLYEGTAPASAEVGAFGGVLKTGYQTIVILRGLMDVRVAESMQPSPYVALKPDPAVASSFNCAEFRIYTDLYDTFLLPGSVSGPSSSHVDAGRPSA